MLAFLLSACLCLRGLGCIRSPTARSPCSTVSLTALHIVRTLAITGCGGASEASWTRIGHARDQLTRARACGNGATPLWGILPASTIYNTPDKFLSKIMPVRYQLRIEINPYLLTHVYTYRHILLVVWYKCVLLLGMLYQL